MRLDVGGEALGGFIQGWDGMGGMGWEGWGGREGGWRKRCAHLHITIKQGALSTIKRSLREKRSIHKYVPKQTRGGRNGGGAFCGNMHNLVNWVGGYFDCSTCTCLHGSCVLCMS